MDGLGTVFGGRGADMVRLAADRVRDEVLHARPSEGGDRIHGFEVGIGLIDVTFIALYDKRETLEEDRVVLSAGGRAPQGRTPSCSTTQPLGDPSWIKTTKPGSRPN